MASPMPIEAPVTTATFPERSMSCFYSVASFKSSYEEMIAECLAGDKLFGIVRAKEDEGVADIGCTAEILDVTKKYPDGRMDIATAGRRRFEVMEVNQGRAFLQAEVLYIEDDPGSATKQEIDTAVE